MFLSMYSGKVPPPIYLKAYDTNREKDIVIIRWGVKNSNLAFCCYEQEITFDGQIQKGTSYYTQDKQNLLW